MSQIDAATPDARAESRRYAILVGATVVLALGLRAWALYLRGALDYDETYYYILGENLFSGKGYTLNGLPHTAFPPLYPIFCGLTSLFSSNVLFCVSLVSGVAGGLLPVPVYFLGRDMCNRRVGLVAAALAAAWPALCFFAVRHIPYDMRMYAGSEPLFGTLIATGILFLWLAARRDSMRYAALAGGAMGLAILTRNEGALLFVCLLAWFAADRFLFSPLRKSRQVLQAAVVAVAFLAVISPFVLYVHSVSGKWGMGSKLTNLARTRPSLYNWIQRGISVGYVRIHYALNADSTELEDDYWGVSDWHRHHKSGVGGLKSVFKLVKNPDGRWLPVLWWLFTRRVLPLVPRYMWPLIILGALLPPLGVTRTRGMLLYAAVVFALLVQAVVIYAIARFQLPLLPLLAIPAARGLDALARGAAFIAGILTRRLSVEPFVYAALPVALVGYMAYQGVRMNYWFPRVTHVSGAISSNEFDAELSAVLKATLPPGSTVMCNKPWVPLYAGLEWRASPFGPSEGLVKYALAKRIDFAVLGIWQMPKVVPGMALYPYLARKITLKDGEEAYLFDFRPGWSAAAH